MIDDLEGFHYYVGKTIMFCQCIEHDIKLIYAGMLEGDFDENYDDIEKWTLGKTVKELQKLDNSDNKPYFHKNDYNLLEQITSIRNYWAHEAYTSFVYEDGYSYSRRFEKEADRLGNDHNRLSNVHKSVERVRLNVLREYNRIN